MNTAAPMLASPIKWVGGKSKLRRHVIERLPDNAECYAEVFAGAAWVLFGKPRHPVEVINDRDDELANLWRVLKWRSAELLEEVHHWLYSRAMFLELRASKPTTELDRAAKMYLLIQMAFGADISSSESASFGYWNKSRGDLFLCKSLDDMPTTKARLRGVFVENLDFQALIEKYDQPRTIFFCDPPYLDTCGYAEKFTEASHIRLRDTLRAIEGKFLLTVNDHPALRLLYADFHIEEASEARAKALASEGRVAAPILFISNYVPEIKANHARLFDWEEAR